MQIIPIKGDESQQIEPRLLDISHTLLENFDALPAISYIREAVLTYTTNIINGTYQCDIGEGVRTGNKLLVLMGAEILSTTYVTQSGVRISVDTLLSLIPPVIAPSNAGLTPRDYLSFARENVGRGHHVLLIK